MRLAIRPRKHEYVLDVSSGKAFEDLTKEWNTWKSELGRHANVVWAKEYSISQGVWRVEAFSAPSSMLKTAPCLAAMPVSSSGRNGTAWIA